MNGPPGKRKVDDESTPAVTTTKAKTRKYDEAYLALGFTNTTVGSEERPQCVVCLKILFSDSMKPKKLRRHLDTSHSEHKEKPVDFFRKKLLNCHSQRSDRRIFKIIDTYLKEANLKLWRGLCGDVHRRGSGNGW